MNVSNILKVLKTQFSLLILDNSDKYNICLFKNVPRAIIGTLSEISLKKFNPKTTFLIIEWEQKNIKPLKRFSI